MYVKITPLWTKNWSPIASISSLSEALFRSDTYESSECLLSISLKLTSSSDIESLSTTIVLRITLTVAVSRLLLIPSVQTSLIVGN